MLSWMFSALGAQYTFLLPLAGIISFVLALLLVIRGKGPMAGAAIVLIVHIPFLIGIFAAIQGAINSYSIIALMDSTPMPTAVASGISTALFAPLVGMLVMVPSYAAAALGAFIRSMTAKTE